MIKIFQYHRSSHDSWFIIKQINFQSSHKAFKEFLKHRRMINLSMQCFNQIQVMNTNTFILWVSIHEYQKILFVISILQDHDYDLDITYSNQIVNLKLIIKSLKLISKFTKYHEIKRQVAFHLKNSFLINVGSIMNDLDL